MRPPPDLEGLPREQQLEDAFEYGESQPVGAELGLRPGDQAVYAFYLRLYRNHAEGAGETRWPVKIGMTTSDVAVRMDGFGVGGN